MNRRLLSLGAAIALTLLTAASVVAKGPGVEATLDPMGPPPRAGDPTQLGVTLRDQNGNPVVASAVSFTLSQVSTHRSVTAAAVPSGATGHYVAKMTLPAMGGWVVHVVATGPQMETRFNLDVLQVRQAAASAAAPPATDAGLPTAIWLLAIVALGIGCAAAILGRRTVRRTSARMRRHSAG